MSEEEFIIVYDNHGGIFVIPMNRSVEWDLYLMDYDLFEVGRGIYPQVPLWAEKISSPRDIVFMQWKERKNKL